MRRSQAPSAKRPRLDEATAAQAWNIAQARPATGIDIGGHLGLSTSSSCCGVTGPDPKQSGPAGSGTNSYSGGKNNKPLRPPLSGHGLNINKQFKCPVPGASGASCRGSLGLKKSYSNITGDLLRSIQRTVILRDDPGAAGAATAVSELVLYDPAEHRLQLQQEHLEQHNAVSSQHPTQAAAEVTNPEPIDASHAPVTIAGTGASHSIKRTDPSHAHTAVVAATDQMTHQQKHPHDHLLMLQQELTSAAASPMQADSPQTVETQAAKQEQLVQHQQDFQFGINWSERVKVHADLFLVEKLRPHQREGLKFVFECLCGVRQEGIFGAVLADGMGLGKTFQTIASLYSLMTKGVTGAPTCKKPLILCPTSLVQNWGKELRHWLGDRVTPVVVDDTRADCVKKSFQSFRAYSPPGKAPKVLVMSYPCFRMHKNEVYKMGIDVVMCDEAHFLKNGEAQITQAVSGLSARRRLLMSGTPIQNDLSEFHAVFDLACPGLLGDIKAFNKTYEGPIQRGRDADATDKQAALGLERMAELMKLCNKFMLRRTSTVLKALLPAKVEQVVFCKLSPLQLKLYNAFLSSKPVQALLASTAADEAADKSAGGGPKKRKSAKTAARSAAPAAVDKENIVPGGGPGAAAQGQQKQQQPEVKAEPLAPLVAITALKKLCCHPDLIWEMLNRHKVQEKQQQQQEQVAQMLAAQRRVSGRAAAATGVRNYASMVAGADSDDEEGKGGQEKGGKKRKSNSSSNSKGRAGRLTGFEGTEPLFTQADVYPAYQPSKCQAYHSGKVMVLESLLKAIRASEPTDKVVLVSNYTEALDILGGMCTAQRWVSLRLDGSCSVKQRQAIVDTFNDPQHPSFVLLLSSKAGGVGLNIIGANRLVLFDPDWNPANDLQAMARVWREGQKKRVWIYRMLMAGSIEEKVLQRQLAKQGLSEALVDEVGQEVRTFSRDELRSLFRVNPSVACETHHAIKCSCDGSLQARNSYKQQAAAASSSGESEQQGVMAWAHLSKASDSPDPTWQAMTSFVRDNYVTFVFSDHVLDEVQPSDAPQPTAAVAGRTNSLQCQGQDHDLDGSGAEDGDAGQEEDVNRDDNGISHRSVEAGSDKGKPAAVVMLKSKPNGCDASKLSAARVAARPPRAKRISAGPATAAAALSRPASRLRRNSAPAAAATSIGNAAQLPRSEGSGRGEAAVSTPSAAVVSPTTEGSVKAAASPISGTVDDEENLQSLHDFGCDADDDPDGWFQ